MTFMEHLEELRTTLIHICLIVAISFLITYAFSDAIAEFLLQPLRKALAASGQGQIVYLGLLDKIMSELQVSFWSSLIVASPFWFFALWRFVRPGLYDYEVRVVRPFIVVSFLLFVAGVAFGYYVIFPFTFETLLGYGVSNVTATISLKEYLVLASKVLVCLGIVFQLPNVMLILGFMGLVTKYSLRQHRRYVIVGLAVASAIFTPPDVISMLGMLIPLLCLYEVGILAVALIVHPYLARQHK